MGLSPLPFTTVEDDPYVAPVLKVPAVQAAAGHDKVEHLSRHEPGDGLKSLARPRRRRIRELPSHLKRLPPGRHASLSVHMPTKAGPVWRLDKEG